LPLIRGDAQVYVRCELHGLVALRRQPEQHPLQHR
jgi:hypothetical protein